MAKKKKEFFCITSVSRDDLEQKWGKAAQQLSDAEMTELASHMAQDYLDQLFWTQIDVLGEMAVKERRWGHKK